MVKRKYILVRNLGFGDLIETFLVFSVASIVAIRVFLDLTGYPQLGGEGLHIAHMLWGGLIMLIVLAVCLIFLNVEVKKFTAIFGGIGFGMFIDEVGKFVTDDNNYFFEPTFSLMYIIFVALFLSARAVEKYKKPTKKEYLINSLEALKGAMISGISRADKRKALDYLSKSDGESSFTKGIRDLYESVAASAPQKPGHVMRVRNTLADLYTKAIRWKWFGITIIIFFLLQAFFSIFVQFSLIFEAVKATITDTSFEYFGTVLDTPQMLSLVVDAVSGAFIIIGAIRIKSSRVDAYHWFKRALLVDIFLGQIFIFYTDQLSALIGLLVKIALLEALNYMIKQEKVVK